MRRAPHRSGSSWSRARPERSGRRPPGTERRRRVCGRRGRRRPRSPAARARVEPEDRRGVSAHSAAPRGGRAAPSNLYGATKAWAEALGSWIAASSATSVVALRIVYFSERPPDGDHSPADERTAWLSHGDCVRLIQAAVETEREGLTVVNGISANRHRIAELGDAERGIGYAPLDDAWQALESN